MRKRSYNRLNVTRPSSSNHLSSGSPASFLLSKDPHNTCFPKGWRYRPTEEASDHLASTGCFNPGPSSNQGGGRYTNRHIHAHSHKCGRGRDRERSGSGGGRGDGGERSGRGVGRGGGGVGCGGGGGGGGGGGVGVVVGVGCGGGGALGRGIGGTATFWRCAQAGAVQAKDDMGSKVETASSDEELNRRSCWANMPPELLRDVILRVEQSESQWPNRKNVVACSGVCSSWREITKELVKKPEQSGRLTFPISLKQPGPRDSPIQCYIKRDRVHSTFSLFLGIPPGQNENGKFLLGARKFRKATCADYIISLNPQDMSRGSNTYVGKLRSNFLGTKFTIYDSQPPVNCPTIHSTSRGRSGPLRGSKQVSPRVPPGNYPVATITYEINMLGTKGPRRMHATLNAVPASSLEPGGSVPCPADFGSPSLDEGSTSVESMGGAYPSPSSSKMMSSGVQGTTALLSGAIQSNSSAVDKSGPLVLKNKTPRWHDQLQCWCLNFHGRVTVASVKNFQLVAANDTQLACNTSDHDKVLLQFGKIGSDQFTMDYRYPLSAFQAFAICLSSFDTKLACE
ncbi:hypothetical protein CBR_g12171 [Chara braunii]|uniref:Tubby-like F-box protein n=1 Tax=Chara braunii TaxID=69332 RepID=A0A388KRH0_CHABU|nr:hypothetical protein CBR_g12171 [Chara braunii]|eukprot:GBG72598.1 hypothetical protein CBR_g12171 [Chara braunii]